MKKRIVISLIVFIIWTLLVFTNKLVWFDDAIYNFLYGFKGDTCTKIMQFFTIFAEPIILTGVGLVVLICKYKKFLFLVGTICGSSLLNLILKNIFRRERPLHFRFIEEKGFSFPSGHAMASMSFYGFLIILIMSSKLGKKYKYFLSIILGIIIFLVGLSRIYLGVHYPSDIISGYLVSFMWLNIVYELMKKERVI